MGAHAEAADAVVVEGDEEVQYVYVELPKDVDQSKFGAGTVVQLEGLGTAEPALRSADGQAVLLGRYEDTLGSVLLIREQSGGAFNAKPVFSYLGHTDKRLVAARQQGQQQREREREGEQEQEHPGEQPQAHDQQKQRRRQRQRQQQGHEGSHEPQPPAPGG